MKNKLIVEPFMNSIGQTINPGDKIVYFTRSIRSDIDHGVYRGVYKPSIHEIHVAVIHQYIAKMLVHKKTGVHYSSAPQFKELWDKYYAAGNKTVAMRDAHYAALEELRKEFHEIEKVMERKTTLFRNRVFLAGTPIDLIDFV